ncbi:MAG: phosphodiesterase [Clostridium sp.]|nr:phosphodiesterase [Clostridium sp.]
MKWMIASDIHGSEYYCGLLLKAYEREQAERMLLLGDILYHGPRNDLPKGYNPKEVTEMLNTYSQDIFCVRGNCDTEVDQMVLDFPIMADYCIIAEEKRLIYATHGHHFNEESLPPLHKGDILLGGHTHVPACTPYDNYTYLNPGSVSIPKERSWRGYMILENETFIWKDLEGREKMIWKIQG